MLRIIVIAIMICCGLMSCASREHLPGLTIACAASAQFAVRDLANSFSADRDLQIDVITGSSGRLTTQIMNGAPYDIFFSANTAYPQLLVDKEMTEGLPIRYGLGIPVIWTMKEELDLENLETALPSSSVNKIAIADPKNAPYGITAEQFLRTNNWYETIKPKLVFGESISQVNEYVVNRVVDIGISAKSIVFSPKLKGKGKMRELGKAFWIQQDMVALKNDRSLQLKNDFLQFVGSDTGKGILKKYGFAF